MNKTQAIQAKIAEAKASIEAALFTGGDTAQLRVTLADLETELALAEQAAADAAMEHQQAEAERADQLAAEVAEAAQQALVNAVGPDVVADVQMPASDADPVIERAAARLSAARDRLDRENVAFQRLTASAAEVRERLAAKVSARDAILTRRSSGDERPGDSGEVLLLTADIESLRQMAQNADSAANAARPTAAIQLVNQAEAELTSAKDGAVFRAKLARLQALEVAFLTAHSELVAAGAAIGQRNRHALFRASQELRYIAYGTV